MKEKSSFDDLFRRKLNDLSTPNEDESWQQQVRKKNEFVADSNIKNEKRGKNKSSEDDKLEANTGKALNSSNDSVKRSQNEGVEASLNNKSAINSSISASDSIHQQAIIQKDSLQKVIHSDSSKIAVKTNITIKKHKSIFIDGGIQLQQQIPLGTQKVTAYNYNGNKNRLLDYIPSLYIRLEKQEQWFLQAEFDYASPYNVNKIVYSQHTQTNYTYSTITTINNRLQKVFYSQLPVSFHYYIQPHWTVGAGVAYNWFRGAVMQQTTDVQNFQPHTQTLSHQMIPVKNYTDSFLYKTKTSLLLQTNYVNKRWTVGLRYWQDVQPFIKYTLPDGTIDNKRSSSLQLLVNYRLFRETLKLKKDKRN